MNVAGAFILKDNMDNLIISPHIGPKDLTFQLHEFENLCFKIGEKKVFEIASPSMLDWFGQFDNIIFKNGDKQVKFSKE